MSTCADKPPYNMVADLQIVHERHPTARWCVGQKFDLRPTLVTAKYMFLATVL